MRKVSLQLLAEADAVARYGGKAASLARLVAAGVAVPPGLVLGVEQLDAQLMRLGLKEEADALLTALAVGDAAALNPAAERIRAALAEGPLAPELVAALHAGVTPDARHAVRSSAPAEDGAAASFAGQFDSVLGCESVDAVAAAVRRVWASLFGERALRYALHRKHHPRGMAVIVQRQVDAVVSGVLFTHDPRGSRDTDGDALLVEYCAGLGERLVAGELVPGRLRIARADGAVTREQAPEEPVAIDPAGAPIAAALLAAAQRLERLFDAPLDIEWCLDGAGRLVVLQARPITATAVPTPSSAEVVWTNANIAENFPEPVCPLLESVVARGYGAYFRGLGIAFGISRRRIEAMAAALDAIVATHAGRLYYNLTNIHRVLHLAPGGPWLARFFNQFTGAEGFPHAGGPDSGRFVQALEAGRVALFVVWRYLRVGRSLRAFEAEVDRFATASAPAGLGSKGRPELARLLRWFLEIRLERWTGAALADTAAMVCYGVLKGLLRGLPGADANDLLKGLPGLASAVPVERLWALSRQLRAEPELHALLRDAPPERLLERLREGEFAEFNAALEAYFERWGFRYSGELMLSRPTPQEAPLPVLRLLRSYAALDGDGPAEVSRRQARAREAATRALRARLGPAQAVLFGTVARAAQGAIRLRERARMKQALLYTRLRHVALALGDRLVAEGLVARREDALFVTIDEAIALADGSAALPEATRGIVAARRAALDRCNALSPPDSFRLPSGTQWRGACGRAEQAATGAAVLTGTGACGGRFCGTATVVLDVAEIDRIRPDQILVTRQTDPGWASVFFMIRGLVIERGGMLSHGAIIAREYGIPAVVGVRDATRLIADGETLCVDGDRGRAERVGE